MIKVRPGEFFDVRYEILSELGKGGMGEVFLARQVDADRIVALKLLAWGDRIDEGSRKRFLREFKILASLKHPHIMDFYHLSITNTGMLYAACEYIKGPTLRKITDADGKIPWNRMLNICIQICEGMEVAHKQGVIHRDLKPDNIMLLENDFAATVSETTTLSNSLTETKQYRDFVKIIDFGLSRIADVEEAKSQKLTFTGQLLGSVHYMSPEQSNGLPLDQRSDIYSLACLTFEMLAGERLFDADNALGVMAQQRVMDQGERLQVLHGIVPSEFIRILQKMLNKDPDKRYSTMNELREELLNLAGNKNLQLSTRAVKVKKSWKLAATVCGSLLLIAGILFEVNRTGLFNGRAKNAIPNKNREETVKNMIGLSAAARSQSLTKLKELAKIQMQNKDIQSAIGTYENIRSLQESRAVIDEIEIAKTLEELSVAYITAKDFKNALKATLNAESLFSKRLGPNDAQTIAQEQRIGHIYRELNLNEKAEQYFEEALRKSIITHGLQSFNSTFCVTDLFKCYIEQNKLKQANSLIDRRLKVQNLPAPLDTTYILTQMNLADALNDLCRFTEAELILKKCLELSKGLEESRSSVELDLNRELIESLLGLGKENEAKQVYRKFQVLETSLHRKTKTSVYQFTFIANLLAERLLKKGEPKEAIRLYKCSLGFFDSLGLGDDYQATVPIYQLAVIYNDQHRNSESVQMYNRLVKRAGSLDKGKEDSIELATQLNRLASVYAQGKVMLSEEGTKKAAEVLTKIRIEDARTDSMTYKIAELFYAQHRYSEAAELYKRLVKRAETLRNGKADPIELATQLGRLASAYAADGKVLLSEEANKRAVDVFTNEVGIEDSRTSSMLYQLASLYYNSRRYAESEAIFKRLVERAEKLNQGNGDPIEASAQLAGLAAIYELEGKESLAIEASKRAVEILAANIGIDDRRTVHLRCLLAILYQNSKQYDKAETIYQQLVTRAENTRDGKVPALESANSFFQYAGFFEKHQRKDIAKIGIEFALKSLECDKRASSKEKRDLKKSIAALLH